jgi:hypothetical protein
MMAGTTGLEPATSAVTVSIGYKNHRLTGNSQTYREPISPLESIGGEEVVPGFVPFLDVSNPKHPTPFAVDTVSYANLIVPSRLRSY